MSFKISVITVVKNGMPFLKDAINSFNNQDYKDKELIIVYSKSNDGTLNFLKKNKKKNFKIIIDNKYKNKFGPLNIGIKKSSGKIIGILHADDLYNSKNTLSLIAYSFKKEMCDVVYGDCLFCNKKNINKIVRKWNSSKFEKKNLKYGWMPPHTTIYVKKKIILKNLYLKKYPISGDYDFTIRLFLKNLKFFYLNKFLCKMRVGGDSTKIKNYLKKFLEDIEIAKKYFKNYKICIFFKIFRKLNQFI